VKIAFVDRFVQFGTALRAAGERPVLVAVIGVAVLLLVLVRFNVRVIEVVTDGIADRMVPAVALVREPIALTRRIGDQIGALLAVRAENERLRAENRRLLEWQSRAVWLTVENRSLRTMLDMTTATPETALTTAQIVADSAGPFVHTRLIDAGRDHAIEVGMAVLTPQGMVGRIIDVGARSARVLLLTDFNSKLPVIIERSGDQALLAGDNTAEPKLQFLPMNPRFAIGDRVMTSGKGGVLPPGLMIGEIARIDGGRVAVRTFVEWPTVDFVSVLRHAPLPAPESDTDGGLEPTAPELEPEPALADQGGADLRGIGQPGALVGLVGG
jgi:rod shape-determining protein MreC